MLESTRYRRAIDLGNWAINWQKSSLTCWEEKVKDSQEKNKPRREYRYIRPSEEGVITTEVVKGVWGMPRLLEAKKDVLSCDKLRGTAQRY